MPTTPNLGLQIPTQGTVPWDSLINGNFSSLDSLLSGVSPIPALSITGKITSYSGVATAGQGAVVVVGATNQRSESAADANVLTFTPPAAAGLYEIGVNVSVSAAASAVLGWTATWTDSNGNAQTPTNLALSQISTGGASGAAAPALTFTTSAASNYSGNFQIDVGSGAVPIVIKFTLTGGTVTAKVSAFAK